MADVNARLHDEHLKENFIIQDGIVKSGKDRVVNYP
jgi:hypothetical protein